MPPAASKVFLTFTKVSATSAVYVTTIETHNNSGCIGPAPSFVDETGVYSLNGTKDNGMRIVDRVDIRVTGPTPSSSKDISFVDANLLTFGDESQGPDGYPNALGTVSLAKQ